MAKNSTLFSNASFISLGEKNVKEKSSQELPGDAVIQNILSFSKALKIKRSRGLGVIEIVLN